MIAYAALAQLAFQVPKPDLAKKSMFELADFFAADCKNIGGGTKIDPNVRIRAFNLVFEFCPIEMEKDRFALQESGGTSSQRLHHLGFSVENFPAIYRNIQLENKKVISKGCNMRGHWCVFEFSEQLPFYIEIFE